MFANALKGLLGAGASRLGRFATRNADMAAWNTARGLSVFGAAGAGDVLRYGSGLRNSSIYGMAAGGAYGAIADDTSVLGGMAMGLGGVAAFRGGRKMYGAYRMGRGAGKGRMAASYAAARGASRHIGSSMTQAYGRIRSSMKG